jgi:DUF4097 and DUF4098 domain-containing protein YvlB
MTIQTKIASVFALTVLLPMLASCGVRLSPARTGPLRTESQSIAASGASSNRVELNMGAGELTLNSGDMQAANTLATAGFVYNVDAWKPDVSYDVHDKRGTLTITQPKTPDFMVSNVRYEWNVSLNQAVPTDLAVSMGAGRSTLNLGGMQLNSAEISTGAGDTLVDLTGAWHSNVNVTIDGGAGKVTVHLPKDVGVKVHVSTGIGHVQARGLNQYDDIFTNTAYGQSATTLTINISAGVGEVQLDVQ